MQILFGGLSLSPILSFVLAGFLAIIISYLAIPAIVSLSHQKGLTNKPNHRTSHTGAVPVLGGVAIFAGLILGGSIFLPSGDLNPFRYIVAAIVILFFVGQKDDLQSISPGNKFFAQLIAALLVVILADVRITTLHGFVGIHEIPDWASVFISVFLIIIIVNSFNLIDGIDGLASGIGIIVSGTLGLWLYGLDYHYMAVLAAALTGGLIPFFFFNVFGKKNKLFMGDSGSLLVGLMVAIFVLKICSKDVPVDHFLYMKAAPSVAIGVLLYPLYDLQRIFIIRLAKGRSPFHPDRNHIHHLYLDAGFSHRRSTFYILILNLMAIAWAWIFRNSSILFLALTLLAGAVLVTLVLLYLVKRKQGLQIRLKN